MKSVLSTIFSFLICVPLLSQKNDSIHTIELEEVSIISSVELSRNRMQPLAINVLGKKLLFAESQGDLVQTLDKLPGIHSMNIGMGFSKPSIRGMAFNRVSVVENGVKQEGQQWGADHGLEIDANNVEQVEVRRGPASLLFGSDAMGGVIDIKQTYDVLPNRMYGEVKLYGRSNNNLLGVSAMIGLKNNAWHAKFRWTEQHFGDYAIPADTIVYLTYQLPIYNRKLKNTAGSERDWHSQLSYYTSKYQANLFVSNTMQQIGFFPGAHGIPDLKRLLPDASSWNIEKPYSNVGHFKTVFQQVWQIDRNRLEWIAGFQNNHRQEHSLFHTHYATQPVPAVNPDLELDFQIRTASSSVKWSNNLRDSLKVSAGFDVQYQQNEVGGYGFLIPNYKRFSSGLYFLTNYSLSERIVLDGGIRLDCGAIHTQPHQDEYLAAYLEEMKYPDEVISFYKQRAEEINRRFKDVSGAIGMVFRISDKHLLRWNVGRSFRFPTANELASNGLHHGAFRHEQGDGSLNTEKAWQLDVNYNFESRKLQLGVSPFLSYFDSYIYLKPTGEWSLLPHSGQIYRYTSQQAIFTGAEIRLSVPLCKKLDYALNGEYVFTYNLEEHTALPFSPPATLRNVLTYSIGDFSTHIEHQYIFAQNRIARNEDTTPGASLFNVGVVGALRVWDNDVQLKVEMNNVLNTKYFNHLSFYRKLEIPEPGRNVRVVINIPFSI